MSTATLPQLVGYKLDNPPCDLSYFIIKVLSMEALTIQKIVDALNALDLRTTIKEVSQVLLKGVEKGYFKRMSSPNVTLFSLNKAKKEVVKGITRKFAPRPNRGIGNAVKDAVNSINGPFYVPQVLEKIEEQFPKATVKDVEMVLWKLHHDKTPGFIRSKTGLYLRKQPIK